ncbi:MAG: ATP synthase F0 subunit B [Deltaproteobacteria bacterium]|nr:ATP synthase F0 subunit B [Deltaproteobacteria bacterium]
MSRATLWTLLLTAMLFGLSLSAAAESGHQELAEHDTAVTSYAEGEESAHHGDGHGGHGDLHLVDVLTDVEFIGSVVNFIALLAILVWLGRKPVREFLSSRRKAMEDGLAEASRMKQQAEAKYREYSERLVKLDEEIEKISDTIMQTAQAEKERIFKEADERATRLQQETTNLIEQQMKQLYSDVMREVVDTAMASAEAVLREKLNSQDQQRLAKDFLQQVARTTKHEEKA